MPVMNSGMKQSNHFCFPLHRKSQQNSFVVITSVFEITYMTHCKRDGIREVLFQAQTWSEHQILGLFAHGFKVWLLDMLSNGFCKYCSVHIQTCMGCSDVNLPKSLNAKYSKWILQRCHQQFFTPFGFDPSVMFYFVVFLQISRTETDCLSKTRSCKVRCFNPAYTGAILHLTTAGVQLCPYRP